MIHIVCTHDRVQINVRTMHVFHFDSSSSIFTVSLLRFPHDRTFQRLIVFYFATSFQRGIPLGILLSLNFTREFSKDNSKTIVEQTKEGYIYMYVGIRFFCKEETKRINFTSSILRKSKIRREIFIRDDECTVVLFIPLRI